MSRKIVFIDMQAIYPFGELKEPPSFEVKAQVRQGCKCRTVGELQNLKRLENLSHDSLVMLQKYQIATNNQCWLFYQYVPLPFEKWILAIGEEVTFDLEKQMQQLASYLVSSGIRFVFNPDCLGLSQEMKVKYFLRQWWIEDHGQKWDELYLHEEIKSFFREFRGEDLKGQLTASTNISDRKSASSSPMFVNLCCPPRDRASWDVGAKNWKRFVSMKKGKLDSRIEDSVRRSKEVISKLKGLKTQKSDFKAFR